MGRRDFLRTGLKRLETAARAIWDDVIVKPLARSRRFRRHYEPLYDALVIDCGDHRLAFDPKDKVIGATIDQTRGWFRRESQSVFDALSTDGKVFVDVGANIGIQTIYALLFGGFGKAVCFEPSPTNAMLLRANLAMNRLCDRARSMPRRAPARAVPRCCFRPPTAAATAWWARARPKR